MRSSFSLNQSICIYSNDHTTEPQEAEDQEVAVEGQGLVPEPAPGLGLRALSGQDSLGLRAEMSLLQDVGAQMEGDSPGITAETPRCGQGGQEPPWECCFSGSAAGDSSRLTWRWS